MYAKSIYFPRSLLPPPGQNSFVQIFIVWRCFAYTHIHIFCPARLAFTHCVPLANVHLELFEKYSSFSSFFFFSPFCVRRRRALLPRRRALMMWKACPWAFLMMNISAPFPRKLLKFLICEHNPRHNNPLKFVSRYSIELFATLFLCSLCVQFKENFSNYFSNGCFSALHLASSRPHTALNLQN